MTGAGAGLVLAALLCWGLYRRGLRINLTRFFTVTRAVLIVIAAGVLGYRLRDLQEDTALPGGTVYAFGLSDSVDAGSWYSTLLQGVLKLTPTRTWLQAAGYAGNLAVVMTLFVRGARDVPGAGETMAPTPPPLDTTPPQSDTTPPRPDSTRAAQPLVGRTGPVRATARRADGLTSTVVGLHGWRGAGAAVAHATGTNACGHHSATPYLTLPAHPGGTHLLVTLVVLSADPDVNGDPHARGSGARVRVAVSGEVGIRFPEGTRERVPR